MIFWIFYILFCVVIGGIAKHSGRNSGKWFFISLLTSPVIGGVLLTIFWLFNGTLQPEKLKTGGMFKTFEEALVFARSNYSLDAGEDYKLASKLLKYAACRNDCDRIAVEHID